jgi:hypothetical protein
VPSVRRAFHDMLCRGREVLDGAAYPTRLGGCTSGWYSVRKMQPQVSRRTQALV